VAQVEHGKLLEGPITTEEGRDRELLAYNRMLDAKDSLETAKTRAALDLLNAQNAVAQAQEALAKLQSGPHALGALQIQNRVTQTEYNLAKAKDSLATIAAGPVAKTVQLAQARYEAAQATLEKAQATLAATTVVAPFDGRRRRRRGGRFGFLWHQHCHPGRPLRYGSARQCGRDRHQPG
jgi:uncharacterized protein YPO0396